ncbi:MAG: hypothetical protein ACJ8FY_25090 [Gemmataceae bacterium]
MDTRSAGILGACIIFGSLILTLGSRGSAAPSGPEVGRYQFARSSGVNCFVIDTKTGRLWQRFVDPSGGSTTWEENKGPWMEAGSK